MLASPVAPESLSAALKGGVVDGQYRRRAWTVEDIRSGGYPIFYDLSDAARMDIRRAVEVLRARRIHLGIMEAEDFRVPSFAKDVPELRRRLDEDAGFVVVRGVETERYSDDENALIYWGIGNYLGRVMRQNLRGERLDVVRDRGAEISDPYRLIETAKYFLPHTDNGMLEPRWPDYLGLMCLVPARSGGENIVLSAYTLLREIVRERPDYLARLAQPWHIDPPLEQRLPGGPATWSKPIFEIVGGELKIHYLRYYIEPGMEKAGTPMSGLETEILDYLDRLLERDEFAFAYKLQAGEILFNNNNWTLHGRRAFDDDPDPARKRLLMRIWLWRRHAWPGVDPVDLDRADLGGAH